MKSEFCFSVIHRNQIPIVVMFRRFIRKSIPPWLNFSSSKNYGRNSTKARGERGSLFAFAAISVAVSSLDHHDSDSYMRIRLSLSPLQSLIHPLFDSLCKQGNGTARPHIAKEAGVLPFTSTWVPGILQRNAEDQKKQERIRIYVENPQVEENPRPPLTHLDSTPNGIDTGGRCECCSRCLGRNSIALAAAAAGPSVVHISVTQGLHGMFVGKSIGSGTLIDADGTILTSAHVVVDFQSRKYVTRGKVDVTLQDGRTFEGRVTYADFYSDIAIVKIDSRTPLPSAKLGSSTKLRPGDWVLAIGCPLTLQNTVTAGIVSCVDRKSSDLGLRGVRREYLQTDCAINEGNSGGPLVNLDGEVVGINTMKIAAADGLSFAVPVDAIVQIIRQFEKIGKVVHPWIGLKMLDLNEMIILQLKERDQAFPDVKEGVFVPEVIPRSPAYRAGFQPGDVVIEFVGRNVGSIEEIIEALGDKVGMPIAVVVKRSGNKMVKLTVIPEEVTPDT